MELGLHKPNKSRLDRRLRTSKDFIKGSKDGYFRLHAKTITELQDTYKNIDFNTQEIETMNTILSEALYKNNRSYIVNLSKQINASYENNIFVRKFIKNGKAIVFKELIFWIINIAAYLNVEKRENKRFS